MINFNTNAAKSVLLVAVVVFAMAGGALAAAPSLDTETTNTSETTEIQDAGTQAYNTTTDSRISWEADSPNSSIEITQDGETLLTATPDHYSSVDTGSDGNSDLWYFNVTVDDDGSDYDGLEAGAGESTTLNVTLVNDTEASSPDTTNISYTFSNSEEQAFIASENPEGEESESGLLSTLNVFSNTSDDEDVGTQLSTDSTTITENTSEVQLDTLNSNLTSAFEASTSDASAGDLVWGSYSQVNVGDSDAQFIPVFYQTANEDHEWVNTSEDAYATMSSDGETMTIHNPEALLDDEQTSGTLNVTTVGDEQMGFENARTMLTDAYDVSMLDAIQLGFGAVDFNGDPGFVADELEA